MSDSLGPVLAILSDIAVVAAIIYAAYWAFAIRHALVDHIYRNRALWLGVLTILFVIVVIAPTPTGNDVVSDVLNNAPTVALTVGFLGFVDSTVPIARRSDPLLRNILNWKKSRVLAWVVLILVDILSVHAEIESSNTSSSNVLGLFVVAVIGAPVMLIAARRSKDLNLRKSLKWFALALLFFLGILLVAVLESKLNLSTSSYGEIPYAAVLILVAYALYRSARSLAPINRLALVPNLERPPP